MDGSDTRRIVLLGKTGFGKSTLANTIFGEELFKSKSSASSETSQCEVETKSVNGQSLTLIDTPGFFDTEKSEEDLKPAILSCIIECSPGPHAFLIVLRVERYTEHEQAVIDKIVEYFSDEAFKYAAVVFTHGDQLDEGQTIEDFVQQNNSLRLLVKKCGGRCHVIDNKYWNKQHEYRSNEVQVEKLLKTIDKMVEANKGGCYTNEMLEEVEKKIQQEEKDISQQPGNLSEKEIREQAKKSILQELLIKLAGAATGALLGAFFGAAVGAIKAIIKQIKQRERLALTPIITDAVTAAAVGAVAGGIMGYHAAEGANTPQQAMTMAKDALEDKAQSALKEAYRGLNKESQLKLKHS